MKISELLKKNNKIEIELLLAEVLKKPKEFLYLHPEHKLTNKQFSNLAKYIRRREKGEPIAYILGYKDFMGLRFKVNKHTLIPRPETEGMVEKILSIIPNAVRNPLTFDDKQYLRDPSTPLRFGRDDKIRILDVGTGSGCIAIAIAKQLQNFKFKISNLKLTAIDISSAALKVARANAKTHKVKIKFIKSDLLQNIHQDFDVIIANLPYVPSADYKKLKANLKYEPKNAIFAKKDGLLEMSRLLEQISNLNYQPKLIYLEFDPRQKIKLSKVIKELLPEYHQDFFKDLSGRWRFVEIKKPS